MAKIAKTAHRSGGRKPDKKLNSKAILWTVLGIFFAVLSIINIRYFFVGEDNVFTLYQLKQENERMVRVINELEAENTELRQFIDGLRNDPQIIEEETRRRLNLVKEREILYLDKEED